MLKYNKAALFKVFRIAVIDDETHEAVRSLRLSRLRMILYGLTIAVVFFLICWAIIALTPMRTTIPGYPDYHSKRDAIENAMRIDSLESIISRWELYADNLDRVLTGEETLSLDSLMTGRTSDYLHGKSVEEIQKQDSLLRDIVHREEQAGASDKPADRQESIEGMQFFTPVKGVVAEGFDLTSHPWISLTAPQGTVVASTLEGTVVFTDWSDEHGFTIEIQHAGNIVSIYRDNEKLLKHAGEHVAAGAPIAQTGSSGLNFSIWYKGDPQDPQKFIKF